MGARVIHLADVRARRSPAQPELTVAANARELKDRIHFWTGASGRRYVHTVYNLIDCPELPPANFLLVRREASGQRTVLAIGHLKHAAGSLNLAEVRQRGARLGANEVHIHLLAPTVQQRCMVELDLRSGHIDDGRVSATRH